MKRLVAVSLLFSSAAWADLYRWVDPQSGSVKFSNQPPPWHGDAARERVSPKVEVISSQPKPAPVAERPAPVVQKPAPAAAAKPPPPLAPAK